MLKKIDRNTKNIYLKIKNTLNNRKGEGYIDSGVKIIIAVVIGALLLGLLYTLFTQVVEPSLTDKITGLFNYNPG